MELFFFGLVPLAVLSSAPAVFRFAKWRLLRGAAALVVMVPVLGLACWRLDKASYQVTKRDYASGRGYFESTVR